VRASGHGEEELEAREGSRRGAWAGVGEVVDVECVAEGLEIRVGERGGAREVCALRRVYCLVFVILEDTDGAGEEVKGVEHDKDTDRAQRTRFVAIVVLSAFKFLSDGSGGEEDGLLVFRIELGHALAVKTRRRCCGGRTP
jgi:hypothetical protein